jgi:hypothetical protein
MLPGVDSQVSSLCFVEYHPEHHLQQPCHGSQTADVLLLVQVQVQQAVPSVDHEVASNYR